MSSGDSPEDKKFHYDLDDDAGGPSEEEGAVVEEEEAGAAGYEAEEEEGEFDTGVPLAPDLGMPPEPQTKMCRFCVSEISMDALRCPYCSGYLPIIEGSAFGQHFFFLFASLALFIGTLLPWERTTAKFNLTGADSIAGGFILVFAAYGIIVSIWNIYHRKMIVWPVLLAALDGAIFGWTRMVQISRQVVVMIPEGAEGFGVVQLKVKTYIAAFGPGLYLVVIFSTLVLLSVILSVFKGAKQDARRKADEREARAMARKSRR